MGTAVQRRGAPGRCRQHRGAGQQAGQAAALLKQQQDAAIAQSRIKAQTLQNAINNPSLDTYNAFTLANPEHAAAAKQAYDAMDEKQQRAELQHAATVAGYLNNNRPDDAVAALNARIDADKKAGIDTSDEEHMRDVILSGPQGAATAKAMSNITLASVLGPAKFAETYKDLGGEEPDEQRVARAFPRHHLR